MKKLSKLLCVIIAFCMIAPIVVPNTASAAVKISKTAKTMYVGDTYTLKVSGASKTPKWTSSKKSVATVTSKGKVTAKSEGTATISAKISSKTYKCKITVKNQFSSADAVKKISCELQDTGAGVVAILKNNNTCAVDVSAKLVYYNDSASMLMATSNNNYCLESGASCALFFHAPYDSSYQDVDYSDYKLTMSVEKANYTKYAASKIKVTSNMGSDNVTAEFENTSSITFETIQVACVFYDSNNNAIGYDYTYVECNSPGSVDYKTFNFPYDDNYNTLYPASYKIYVNHAYKYF